MTRVSRSDRRTGKTDLAALDTIPDHEIALKVAADPDAAPLDLDRASAEVVVPPRKVAIAIRVDQDVLDHFKDGGVGYRPRISAVLRAYREARKQSA